MQKEYTKWRRFLAMVGFISLFIYAAAIVGAIVWANHFISINI